MIGRAAQVLVSVVIGEEVVEVSLTTINSIDDQELIKIINIWELSEQYDLRTGGPPKINDIHIGTYYYRG